MSDAFMAGGVPVVRAPADPWAGRTQEAPIVQRRRIYGRVYQALLEDARDPRDTYVGKTTTTLHQRFRGSGSWSHTSAESVAKDPWKARILPGAAGYRLLENVYDTGDPEENRRALARAEADWMRRIEPWHNKVRPVKPIGYVPPKPARPARPAPRRRQRKSSAGPRALAALVALFTALAALLAAHADVPNTPGAWISVAVTGTLLGWLVFSWLQRAARKVKRGFR